MTTSADRLHRSAAATESDLTCLDALRAELADGTSAQGLSVDLVEFSELDGWYFAPGTQNLVHRSGRFFSVEGLRVQMPEAVVPEWTQPVLHQPETAILGILAQEIGGVLHFLMQAKAEPGNRRGVQISPTVQATWSNYTQAHRGGSVPYVEYFRRPGGNSTLVDVRLSEQGSWFYRKRNRNIVVEVPAGRKVEVRPGFHWLTLGQLHILLAEEDLLNMDARSVLACLPLTGRASRDLGADTPGSAHDTTEVLGWLHRMRGELEGNARLVPLGEVDGWHRTAGRISHDSGRFFDVVAVRVEARGRETARWTQPLLEPRGTGVAGFLLREIGGVPHVLARARAEPGYVDAAELGPTVQFNPANLAALPGAGAPALADLLLGAPKERIRYDTLLSEEGGRFRHALNRYLIVEDDPAAPVPEPETHRWVAVHQLTALMRHSGYVNVEARTLVAALNCLSGARPVVP